MDEEWHQLNEEEEEEEDRKVAMERLVKEGIRRKSSVGVNYVVGAKNTF